MIITFFRQTPIEQKIYTISTLCGGIILFIHSFVMAKHNNYFLSGVELVASILSVFLSYQSIFKNKFETYIPFLISIITIFSVIFWKEQGGYIGLAGIIMPGVALTIMFSMPYNRRYFSLAYSLILVLSLTFLQQYLVGTSTISNIFTPIE
ncbi:MAG: hypothetical protein OEY56_08435, partial [Cyclobacteriaceae bacterium]|nr:hypothetical protein [Cyclobacteriaceae bacterium]